jgi:sugar phosphate isomerase/epimerase
MKKISLCIEAFQKKFGDKGALLKAKEIGCDAVDFSLYLYDFYEEGSIYTKSDEEIFAYFSELKKYADEIGIEIGQTHGRLQGFTKDREKNLAKHENIRRDFLASNALGAKYCVMHTCSNIHVGNDEPDEVFDKVNDEMFLSIIPYAKKYGVIAVTETFGDAPAFGTCCYFGYVSNLIRAYDRVASIGDNEKYYKICMDTGHTQKAMRFDNNPSPADAIRMIGKRLGCLHLNDNNGLTDQHKIPYSASVDFDDVLSALEEIGYEGNYNMEILLNHFGTDFEVEEAEFAVKSFKNVLKSKGL